MAEPIPDLWPKFLPKIVLLPIVILQKQALLLSMKTDGVLMGEVAATAPNKDGQIELEFRIVVPALDSYTYALFTARHKDDFPYPVSILYAPWRREAIDKFWEAKGDPRFRILGVGEAEPSGRRYAQGQKDLMDLLRDLFASKSVGAVLESLVARASDVEPVEQPETGAAIPPNPVIPPAGEVPQADLVQRDPEQDDQLR